MRQFKYRQTFATNKIKLIFPEERSKALAVASLEALKSLLPSNLDIGNNPDLLFNSFNAAVVNMVNLNDDGIQTSTALNLYKKFINKFCDLEHERSHIVGFIVNSGFSQFITDKILHEEEAKHLNTPFNISLGSVVWPVANPKFAEMLIESSDETSPHYQEISASWEIGFDEMHLAIGSRDLSEAEIITDPTQIQELKQYLKIYKGEGRTKQNEPIYRVIAGDAIPLGIAYTTSPAAAVKGVIVTKPDNVEDIEVPEKISLEDKREQKEQAQDEEDDMVNSDSFIKMVNLNSKLAKVAVDTITHSIDDKKDKYEKNFSQAEKHTVKNTSMKLTTLDDITDDSLKEFSSATVRNFIGKQISDKIDEVSTEYAQKLEAKDNQVKETKAAQEELMKQFEDTKKQLDDISKQLEVEKEARAKEKLQADFNSRMADLDNVYDLNDQERAVIAKNIRGLDDNQYTEKLQELEVLLAAKKKKKSGSINTDDNDLPPSNTDKEIKATKKGMDDDDDNEDDDDEDDMKDKKNKKKAAKASVEDVLDDADEDKNTPPNTPSIDKTIRDEFADAFKLEDFKFSVKK